MNCIRPIGILVALVTACAATSSVAATITTQDSQDKAFVSSLFDSDRGAGIQQVQASTGGVSVFQSPLRLNKFDATNGALSAIEVTWRGSARRSSQSVSLACRDSGLIDSSCEDESKSQSTYSEMLIQLDGLAGGFVFGDGTSRTYSVAPGDFAIFLGTGTLFVPWQFSYSHSASGECDPNLGTIITRCELSSSVDFDFAASVSVTYSFQPAVTPPSIVPLPAGMPFLLAGLGLLGVLRRRR